MKKLISCIFFCLPMMVMAQVKNYFTLVPNAFVSTESTNKDYIVIEYPNKTAAQLYKAIISASVSVFKSSKDVVSSVENESISMHWFSDGIPVKIGLGFNKTCQYKPTLVWHIKDGKIKIDAPAVETLYGYKGSNNHFSVQMDNGNAGGFLGIEYHMFDKNGVVNKNTASTKAMMEETINSVINGILANVDKELKSDW